MPPPPDGGSIPGMGYLLRKLGFGLLIVVCMVVPWSMGIIAYLLLGLVPGDGPVFGRKRAQDRDQVGV